MELQEAIEMVKSAGYTVRKAKTRKKSSLATVGPTFVARWNDGEITRMSIHTRDDDLDYGRAIKVSFAAYDSRKKGNIGLPIIEEGYFERDGIAIGEPIHDYVYDYGVDYGVA